MDTVVLVLVLLSIIVTLVSFWTNVLLKNINDKQFRLNLKKDFWLPQNKQKFDDL